MARPRAPAEVPGKPAGMLVRLAAMTYDAVLLFGVVFVVGYLLLAVMRWTYPLAAYQRHVLQAALLVAIGGYFVYSWVRGGQTVAMKAWRLHLVDARGQHPGWGRAILRYLLAWHLFLPGTLWFALFGGNPAIDAAAIAGGFFVMLLPAAFDGRRRLLHDRWTGTQVVRRS
jgi:uncharacterized RDD family membrane protein YckC